MVIIIERLWYKAPAKEWVEALPIGNGFLGAMGYGGCEGLYDITENTCWSGCAEDNLTEDAAFYMKKARDFLRQDKVYEAKMCFKKCQGVKGNYGTYLPMGRLHVTLHENYDSEERELNIRDGVLTDTFSKGGKQVVRRAFASHEERTIRFEVKGELPCITVGLNGYSNPSSESMRQSSIVVHGRALENIHSDGLHGVCYTMRLQIDTDGAMEWSRYGIYIKNATYVSGILTAMTDFKEKDIDEKVDTRIKEAKKQSFDEALSSHLKEHRELMDKCTLRLEENENSCLPTDERIARFNERGDDKALIALYFAYGRYLLLDSVREDSDLPPTLQGIWNDNRAARMEWTDDIHLDINTQMNYFHSEKTGIAETEMPLFKYLKDILMPRGKEVARKLYMVDGWCAHTVTNSFGFAAPGWGDGWGFFVCGGAWMALDIWRHYEYTLDEGFLREYYPVLKGAAECLSQLLERDDDTGCLVLNPSMSPENFFERDKKPYAMTRGTTVDTTICRMIFDAVIESAGILKDDDTLIDTLKSQRADLPPYKVGEYGQLQEWFKDEKEVFQDHRHTSHLLSLYPFETINPEKDKELAKACEVSIQRRFGKDEGDIVLANWAGCLILSYYAKLHKSEEADTLIHNMVEKLSRANMMMTHTGPTSRPAGGIYELDGNTGFTAALCEMIAQQYDDEIIILPAIPSSWKSGEIKGLCMKGCIKLDIKWDEEEVYVSLHGSAARIRYKDQSTEASGCIVRFKR